tara:strand:- start:1401 stop:2663 length:1263 start_codon:yes stop_codon:yes gene_type:complete
MFRLSFKFLQKLKRNLFPFYKNKELKIIFKILQKGFSDEKIVARFVGGCVRKHLLGENIDDIDIATILTTEQIKERFKDTNFKIIETGVKHGTITLLSEKNKFELTTLRKDIATDGRHAEIEYTDNWQLDSERRDFTFNAIYLDISGKIFDPQMGTLDLKNNNVKFIGDPQKRIEEDYLRIIRFLRFKIIYNFKIEPTTESAIKQNLDGIKKISKERVLSELFKIIIEKKRFLQINENNSLKEIFSIIFPEFLYLHRLERLKKIDDLSILNKDIILAVLLIDEKDNYEYFAHKYNISNKLKSFLGNLASNLIKIQNKNFFDKDLTKNAYLYGKKHLIDLNLVNYSINSRLKLNDFNKNLKKISELKVPKFQIDGQYLKKNGMQEGQSIGKVLKIIETEWIKNSFKISDDRIKELIKANST